MYKFIISKSLLLFCAMALLMTGALKSGEVFADVTKADATITYPNTVVVPNGTTTPKALVDGFLVTFDDPGDFSSGSTIYLDAPSGVKFAGSTTAGVDQTFRLGLYQGVG